jgi:hypothetical protein
MNAIPSSKNRLLILVTSTTLVLALLLLASFMSIADAQTEEPPPLTKLIIVDGPVGKEIPPVDTNNLGPEWRPVFQEDFEAANWVDKWDENLDLSNPSVGLKWGTQQIGNNLDGSSLKSGWGICADEDCGNVDTYAPNYPGGVNSVLIAGPFDFSKADDALIDLELLYEANNGDPFRVLVSENRVQFTPQLTVNQTVSGSQFEQRTVSLSQYAGDPNKTRLWIAFAFESGNSASKMGAMIDNISVWSAGEAGVFMPYVAYGFTPTPLPVTPTATPTATPEPGSDYETQFTDTISPWHASYWSENNSYILEHNADCDDNRCGFLELTVEDSAAFVLVSPTLVSKKPPYTVETRALIKDKQDGDKYSLVWGGSWNGAPCPQPDLSSCFNEYYELRVRYRIVSKEPFLEYRLMKVTGHDSSNQPEGDILIDWEKVKDINPAGWVKWSVDYEADGKMTVYAEDDSGSGSQKLGSSSSSAFADNPFFGLIVKTDNDDNTKTRVKFDIFRIQ